MFRYRDEKVAKKIVNRLKAMELNLRFMHVCGTHQDTLVRYGLEHLLRDTGIEIRQGPGCPVCVTTPLEIEEALALARDGKLIATFGDMMKVPGQRHSLSDLSGQGCEVRIVYSVDDAIGLAARTQKEVVFLSVGFETTTPSVASAILDAPPSNFSILSCHRVIPPALKALIEMGELRIDGLIEPGHVSTIIGAKPYEFISERYNVPQVIAGFEPLDLLMGVYMLAEQVRTKTAKVDVEYRRSVRYEGNEKAVEMMREVFEPVDARWRGFPVITGSGLRLRPAFARYDARGKFAESLKPLAKAIIEEPMGCRCGEVLRGIIDSAECPLFAERCTPTTPVGPCMVSREGNCNIRYRYRDTMWLGD